jgi:hypothetical protein
MRMNSDKRLLDQLQLNYRVLESGCCGMARAFGQEAGKFSISQRCGELKLFR